MMYNQTSLRQRRYDRIRTQSTTQCNILWTAMMHARKIYKYTLLTNKYRFESSQSQT